MKTQRKILVSTALALVVLAFNLALVQPVQANGFYEDYASLHEDRAGHTATVIPNSSPYGQLLVAGGYDGTSGEALPSVEIYTLTTGGGSPEYGLPAGDWTYTGSLNTPRYFHSALSLTNGDILVAGGNDGSGALDSAELYDPSSGTWCYTGSMNYARQQYTMTLLPNGLVLAAGGDDGSGNAITNAELYNPATGTWTNTGSMTQAREGHTATLLPNGKVLVTGGSTIGIGTDFPEETPPVGGSLASAEIYDPATGTWTATGSMNWERAYHTATLQPNGLVLIAGGMDASGNALASTEVYDPFDIRGFPTAGQWLDNVAWLNDARYAHTATMLPDGRVLVSGGFDSSGNPVGSGETYYPVLYVWSPPGFDGWLYTSNALPQGRGWMTANVLYGEYSSFVVTVGGLISPTCGAFETDVYDVLNENNEWWGSFYNVALGATTGKDWKATDWMNGDRYQHTATLLTNGQVLVVGGFSDSSSQILASAELYNSANGLWTNTASMSDSREYHTATLLTNGWVLIAGGDDNSFTLLASAELYKPDTGTWTNTGSMNSIRIYPAATLLTNGEVLVCGGYDGSEITATAELYNPGTGTWTNTGSMNIARGFHTATLLSSGKVLVAGGFDPNGNILASAELYNPVTGTWTNTGSMNEPRVYHTATFIPGITLLHNVPLSGEVLVAGGGNPGYSVSDTAEVYNTTNGTWSYTGPMNFSRSQHTATYFPAPWGQYGTVLVAGGRENDSYDLPTVEEYNPQTGTWSIDPPMDGDRYFHTATLLPNGQLLVTGGRSFYWNTVHFCELYGGMWSY